MAPLTATLLRCNDLRDPLGVDTPRPLLGWTPASQGTGARGERQSAYHLRAAWSAADLDERPCWDTGWVESDRSVQVPWAGPALPSRQAVTWKVKLRDGQGAEGPWSAPASWEMGLLSPADWTARWIAADTKSRENPATEQPAPYFRTEFTLAGRPVAGRAWVCGLGWYELHVNGARSGDGELQPAFTRYDARALYVTHDITPLLREGRNALGTVLGTGWYDHTATDVWDFKQAPWRDQPKLILQVHVRLADGTETTVISSPAWRWQHGPIVADALRNGEQYDACRELTGWDEPGYDQSGWHPVRITQSPGGLLASQQMTPIRVSETIVPVSVNEPGPGVFVFDLGRNITGRARIRAQGKRGSAVVLRYAEKLKDTGDIDQSNIDTMTKSGSFQADSYAFKGTDVEEWESRFSSHGFQYVQAKGWPGRPTAADLDGRAVHTDFEPRGEFSCSLPLLNAIHEACRRSTLYNYHGFPTDCPQRERNGWTGDAQLSAEQALFNFDMDSAYRKWMADIRDCQRPSGQIPAIVPTGGWGFRFGSGPAWDSAALLIPWYLYVYRGDAALLDEHYECMRRYVEFLGTMENGGIVDFGLGDWCPPEWKPSVIWNPTYRCPAALTDTAYYAVDARILSAAARVTGRADDAERYDALARRIRSAFRGKFLDTATGKVVGDCQASHSCALYQGMVDPAEKPRVLERLVETVEKAGRHIDTGMLGAKYVMHSLTDAGRVDLAWAMATQTTWPGWGDFIRRGATTLWETWSGDSSRNHHMFSDIGAWFYRGLAGLAPDPAEPGFRHFTLTPRPVGDLALVTARHRSPYGWIEVEWRAQGTVFELDLTVPVGCHATVLVPAADGSPVHESGAALAGRPGIPGSEPARGGTCRIETESGRYRFSSTLPAPVHAPAPGAVPPPRPSRTAPH